MHGYLCVKSCIIVTPLGSWPKLQLHRGQLRKHITHQSCYHFTVGTLRTSLLCTSYSISITLLQPKAFDHLIAVLPRRPEVSPGWLVVDNSLKSLLFLPKALWVWRWGGCEM